MAITPYLIGSGNAGKAIQKSLAILAIMHPEWELLPAVKLARDSRLDALRPDPQSSILFIANPHGLHAKCLLEGARAGFRYMATEKPACVSREEIRSLTGLAADVGVFHGYRQMWGPQAIREMIAEGELGAIFALEGRYWQSSAAQRALSPAARRGWKDDRALNGPHDTLVDLGAHWVDLALFLAGERPTSSRAALWYVNAEAPHRDTHVHMTLEFPSRLRAQGSISKTVHGAGNHLELVVLGAAGSATWRFESPDEIVVGRGSRRTVIARTADEKRGASQAPFHGLGWLEGYMDVTSRMIRRLRGETGLPVPTLAENLTVMELILSMGEAAAI